jgi:hypothetical protein
MNEIKLKEEVRKSEAVRFHKVQNETPPITNYWIELEPATDAVG